MSYKIKISCTSKEELCYNNEKISKENYNKIGLDQLVNNYDYIKESYLLFKRIDIITKTLEFSCNNEISENDFELFIKNMHDIGFTSEQKRRDTCILFISNDDPHNPIHTYNFRTIKKIIKNKTNKKLKNRSKYYKVILSRK